MADAQQWLDKNYPDEIARQRVEKLIIVMWKIYEVNFNNERLVDYQKKSNNFNRQKLIFTKNKLKSGY